VGARTEGGDGGGEGRAVVVGARAEGGGGGGVVVGDCAEGGGGGGVIMGARAEGNEDGKAVVVGARAEGGGGGGERRAVVVGARAEGGNGGGEGRVGRGVVAGCCIVDHQHRPVLLLPLAISMLLLLLKAVELSRACVGGAGGVKYTHTFILSSSSSGRRPRPRCNAGHDA